MQINISREGQDILLTDDEVFAIYKKQKNELIMETLKGYLFSTYPVEEASKYVNDEQFMTIALNAYDKLENVNLPDSEFFPLAIKEAKFRIKTGQCAS